jgi:hypothetical protein
LQLFVGQDALSLNVYCLRRSLSVVGRLAVCDHLRLTLNGCSRVHTFCQPSSYATQFWYPGKFKASR